MKTFFGGRFQIKKKINFQLIKFSNFRNLTYLKRRIKTADDRWLWEFLTLGGFEDVISACEKSFQERFHGPYFWTVHQNMSVEPWFKGVKNKMNLQNGIYKMVAVQCLKAVITPEIGLRYFCDENHSILVNGLKSDNPLVKKQILEVMCGLSLYSYFEYFSYSATQTSRNGIYIAF